jgi:superoxide reductase
MAVKYGIYRCETCGNLFALVYNGGGTSVCCGQEMTLLKVKTVADEGKEKHVPIMEINGKNVTVRVGSIPHPMEEKHYIAMIRLLQDGKPIAAKLLEPGMKPEAVFCVDNTANLKAEEVCNLHGLWSN